MEQAFLKRPITVYHPKGSMQQCVVWGVPGCMDDNKCCHGAHEKQGTGSCGIPNEILKGGNNLVKLSFKRIAETFGILSFT